MKKFLIHLLGGATQGEVKTAMACTMVWGRRDAYQELLDLADSISGTEADEWCKTMYEAIKTGKKTYGDDTIDELKCKIEICYD